MRTSTPRVVKYRHSRTSRFVVDGLRVGGKRVRRFFGSEREAKAFLREFQARAAKEGVEAPLLIPDSLRIEAITLAERLRPLGATLTQAVEHFLAYRASVSRSCSVAELVASFREANVQDGLAITTLRDRKSRLGRFAEAFGDRVVATIQGVEVADWLRARGTSPRDRENYRATLQAMFNFAVLNKYAPANPVAEVRKKRLDDADVGTLTPDQMQAALAAVTAEHLAYLAIGGFAGLRTSEIARLDWKDINLAEGHLFVNKASKTGRRYVTIEPNLAAWLAPMAHPEGRVCNPMQMAVARRAACKAAGLASWPDNGLRHSFGTYHLAHYKNAAQTAHEMGNSVPMIRRHYDRVAPPSEATAWWAILPPSDYGKAPSSPNEAAHG